MEAEIQEIGMERRGPQNGRPRGGVTDRQKRYIAALGKAAGLKVDLSTIDDAEKATRIIDLLKQLNGRMNGSSSDTRDKRVAFGIATKLVFVTHASREKDISKWNGKKFWDDVRTFYAHYVRQQELAVVGNRME